MILKVMLYRGTQRAELGGRRKTPSWTPSLPVAVIYSAIPGDIWSSRKPAFAEDSMIHSGELASGARVLELCRGETFCSFDHVLKVLHFEEPAGLTEDEARKILNYMHNRLVGKAKGGEFEVKLFDEDGEVFDDELPFSLRSPYTLVREYRDRFDGGYAEDTELLADAYIFADAPKFHVVAQRLGWDAVSYMDVFAAAEDASEQLLGCKVLNLDGVVEVEDLDREWVPAHETVRPFHEDVIANVRSVPVRAELPRVACTKTLKRKLMR